MKALKKIGKVFLYVIGGVIVLLFLAGLFIDPIAKKILENQVANAAEGQFSLALEEVDISILGGNFRIRGVVLETDTSHSAAPPILLLKADEIAAEGVSWFTFLLNNRLSIDKVLLDDLNLKLYAHTVDSTQKKSGPFRLEQLDVYPMIKGQVERFRLKDLNLNDVSLTLVNLSSRDTLNFYSQELNLQSDDILIDANKLITDNRAFYATELDLQGKEVVVNRTGNKTLVAKAAYIKFETRGDNIGLLTEEVNFLQTGDLEADTLMSIELEKFLLSDLSMKKIQEDSTGQLDKIELSNVSIRNNFPADPDTSLVADSGKSSKPFDIAEMSLGKSLPEFLKQIELAHLALNGISYRQANKITVDDANMTGRSIVINVNGAFDQNRFLHASDLESSFRNFSFSSGKDGVDVEAAGFKIQVADGIGQMGLQEVKVKPVKQTKDKTTVDIELGAFALSGLNTQRIPDYVLSIDSIGFQKPEVEVDVVIPEGPVPPLDLYPAIEGILESVHLRKLALIDADVRVTGLMTGPAKEIHFPTLYLQATDIEIAEGTAFSGDRVLHSDDIAVRIEELNLPVDKIHTISLDLFRLSTREEFVEAKDFNFDFKGKRGSIPADADTGSVMSVKNELLRIEELDFQRLVQDNQLIAGVVTTEGLQVYMFVDNNKTNEAENGEGDSEQKEQTSAGKSMPQEMMKEITTPFYVREFEMTNGNFIYEELAPEAERAGKAEVSVISVAAKNISNIQTQISRNPVIKAEVAGVLMAAGSFETTVKLDMQSESNLVSIEGHLDTMKITKMNRFTEYTSRLGFESGEIHHLGWTLEIDDELSEGTLEMSYVDLKIRISESNMPSTAGILKNAGSFLANNLVLESDVAPASSDEPQKATFKEERNKEEEFPVYAIQGLISGFMDLMVTIF